MQGFHTDFYRRMSLSQLLSYENVFQACILFYVICKQSSSEITTYSQKQERMEKNEFPSGIL